MSVPEKAKEKLDEASKEIKKAIYKIKLEVVEITVKVKKNQGYWRGDE